MSIQAYVEQKYKEHTDEFSGCPEFQKIESGEASREEYDAFIASVFRTHQNSPNFLAFLLALTAPVAFDRVKHNLLEELGIEEEDGESHPELLLALLEGAGLTDRMDELHGMAKETMKALIVEPMFYESLREYGLAAMAEVFSFEYMLAHTSTRIANALREHRGIPEDALIWFTHPSEVDIQHAEEALVTIQDYVDYYEFDDEEARDIIDMAMQENVFIKRYFGTHAHARAREMF